MHGDRISLALSRIETAAQRISAGARDDAGGATPVSDPRYEALRQEAQAVLAELDRLIAQLEG